MAAAGRAGLLGAGRRAGADRDAHPARRPDRPRAAAPPRRRARGRLAGAARAVPADRAAAVRAARRRLDRPLCPVDSHAARRLHRRASVAGHRHRVAHATPSPPACSALADAVDAQTAEEESVLLPLLAEHLRAGDWAVIARSSHCRLSAREQLLVLGLALEDSSADDRARLLNGVLPATRLAWRMHGRRTTGRPSSGCGERRRRREARSVARRPALGAALAHGGGLGPAVRRRPSPRRWSRSSVLVLMAFSPSWLVHRRR